MSVTTLELRNRPTWRRQVGRWRSPHLAHHHTLPPYGRNATKTLQTFCYRKVTPPDGYRHAPTAWFRRLDAALHAAEHGGGVRVQPGGPHRGRRDTDSHAPSQLHTTLHGPEHMMPSRCRSAKAIESRRHRACASGHEHTEVSGPAYCTGTDGGEPREGAMAELD